MKSVDFSEKLLVLMIHADHAGHKGIVPLDRHSTFLKKKRSERDRDLLRLPLLGSEGFPYGFRIRNILAE